VTGTRCYMRATYSGPIFGTSFSDFFDEWVFQKRQRGNK